VYKNRKGWNSRFVLPCAGIILIRFYGFDLSDGLHQSTPEQHKISKKSKEKTMAFFVTFGVDKRMVYN
jgi:hypothetical protein